MSFDIGKLAQEAGRSGTGACKRRSPEHYKRLVQDRINRLQKTYSERFWKRIKTGNPDECWPWSGAHNEHGYGSVCKDGVLRKAHRVAWELTFGKIPEGKWVLHKCDNPPCCNPNHLYIGTIVENTKDAIERKRFRSGDQHWMKKHIGSANPNTKLKEETVRLVLLEASQKLLNANQISKKFNIPRTTLRRIIDRVTWKHVTI